MSSNTSNIFIFTAANPKAQENLKISIKNSVPGKRLSQYLDEDQLQNMDDFNNKGEFYCWGATPGERNVDTWGQMERGDYVLTYYDKALRYYSKVVEKIRNKKLAKALWGTNDEDETWECIYFLKKPKLISPPLFVDKASDYFYGFRGFTKLSDKRRNKLHKDYGTLEKFLSKNITNGKKEMPKTKYQDLLLTIKTKPFIILAGLSGTGKSRLVRTIAYKTCPKGKLRKDESKPGNFELIKVRPNWHDSTEVIGYESRINGERYVVTDFIRFIVKAWKHPEIPFFLCLDEMNLAPVEQYFAEYLSVFETRKKLGNGAIKTDAIITSNIFEKYVHDLKFDLDISPELLEKFQSNGLTLPQNLVIMGTVNMDETTHSFSHKVLDRAMAIEKNGFDLKSGLEGDDNDWEYENESIAPEDVLGDRISGSDVYNEFSKSDEVIRFLEEVNGKLHGTPFLAAYRVRDEFLIYCYHYSQLTEKPTDWLREAFDHMMHMKILPKIEGEEEQTRPTLEGLKTIATQQKLKRSLIKIEQMIYKLDRQRYTSYWY